MSVPLQTVPDEQERDEEASSHESSVAQANHEAAEVIAQARRQAEAIVAEARASQPATTPSPLAALGENAEEIIGQVRKLIKKQRELQAERQSMADEISRLKTERDELVQRLTDAVVRMEELAAIAATVQEAPVNPPPASPPLPPREATSLSARLEQAEREQREAEARADGDQPDAPTPVTYTEVHEDAPQYVVSDDDRSFYSRHSAKLPRLEGDGGRSVLSAVGGMRPDLEPKGRKGRRSRKKS